MMEHCASKAILVRKYLFTECVICKLRISQNIGSLNQGSRQEGWQLGSEEETKFTYNSKGRIYKTERVI
ncbi:hypothetical protein ABFA07_014393 [Porites harrisoni]